MASFGVLLTIDSVGLQRPNFALFCRKHIKRLNNINATCQYQHGYRRGKLRQRVPSHGFSIVVGWLHFLYFDPFKYNCASFCPARYLCAMSTFAIIPRTSIFIHFHLFSFALCASFAANYLPPVGSRKVPFSMSSPPNGSGKPPHLDPHRTPVSKPEKGRRSLDVPTRPKPHASLKVPTQSFGRTSIDVPSPIREQDDPENTDHRTSSGHGSKSRSQYEPFGRASFAAGENDRSASHAKEPAVDPSERRSLDSSRARFNKGPRLPLSTRNTLDKDNEQRGGNQEGDFPEIQAYYAK